MDPVNGASSSYSLPSEATPYDLRRTYANWLEAAAVPRTRRRLYLGHGARDVTDLYEAHEVAAFLAEDAARLRRYVEGEDASAAHGRSPDISHDKLSKKRRA